MCLLAILFRVTDGYPVVVGANREEYFQRGGLAPQHFDGVRAVGGIDPSHGGTWLGVNANGVLIAVTNRPRSELPALPRSRGLLARDLLGCATAREAAARATEELASGSYAGCNYMCADGRDAVVVHGGDWLRVRPLPAGVHVLSNGDVNDPIDRRVTFSGEWLATRPLGKLSEALEALRGLCASKEPRETPICFRLAERGTVSSSLIALPGEVAKGVYLHSQGPADRVAYEDRSHLLRELGG